MGERSVMHLSYSGQFAGLLLCGSDREDCKARGDRIAHVIATPGRVVAGWRRDGVLCGRCGEVYDGAG